MKKVVKLTERDLQRIVKRVIKEQIDTQKAIDLIKNNIPTIIGIITSVVPIFTIPKLIYFIASGKPQELLAQLKLYKNKIESELKRRNITLTIDDIANNVMKFKNEFLSELDKLSL
jgi:hypothetical protein